MKKTPTSEAFQFSPFTLRVHAVVKKIPLGSTLTYQQVAAKAGNPKAVRAVGTILSKNYDPKIPCHRVIRTDGKIGQYNRGGPAAKKRILNAEAKKARKQAIF